MDKPSAKIIQITSTISDNNVTYLYALCADGSVWYRFASMSVGDWRIVSAAFTSTK